MILENITMEMTANDTAPESEWIRGKTKAGLKQDMAMDRFYRWTAGLMSPAEEKLAGELQQTGGDAWDRLHEQLISNLKDNETGSG